MQPVHPIRTEPFSPLLAERFTRPNGAEGFTLIELIFVVAIVAILLALAYPAYTDQIRKARRADAVSTMMATAQYMERCFTQTNAYNGCTQPAGLSADEYYNISVDPYTANTYTIQAEPQGAQATDPCGTYTLDYLGNKSSDGSDSDRCWADT
ncbi:MAG: type IV pilin protein [Gammaproteobacteria bacterium]|nr:type IV pilin protein [Gammaproteobacteria bacterium]NNJ78624.1 type IV pilin protein [Xanthomonadales bacterium]